MDRDRDSSGNASSSGASRHPLPRGEKRQRQTAKDRALRGFAKAMRNAQTEPEAKLWAILRDRRFSSFKFRRQVPIGTYIADFVCFERRLIVEADGSQHGERSRDVLRDAWLRSQGFRIRRFWNADILLRSTEVKNTLWADLDGQTDL